MTAFHDTPCDVFEVRNFRNMTAMLHEHRELRNLDKSARNTTAWLKGSVKGARGGEWSACTHLQLYGMNVAPMFLRFIALVLQPARALEVGCGLGTTADFISRFSPVSQLVACVEPDPMLGEVSARDHAFCALFSHFSLSVHCVWYRCLIEGRCRNDQRSSASTYSPTRASRR